MDELTELAAYLKYNKVRVVEGSASEVELAYLAELATRPGVLSIAEVGFNAGRSSYNFLQANSEAHVTAFDIGDHKCVSVAKQFIDQRFPGRHTLVLGDSRLAVPDFHRNSPAAKFDLVFIDGGHAYEIARADLLNFKDLSHERTIVVMDDITPWLPWGRGPTKAWRELLNSGVIAQDELVKDGKVVERLRPPGKRAWAVGTYIR